MVPFCISGMRFCEVTACVATFRSARPVAFFTASTMRPQISQPKPVGWPSRLTKARLHFVTGKGGTGKSTIAAALALALAAGGRKVLLVEVEGRQGIAQLFDVPPLPYEEVKIATADGGGYRLDGTKLFVPDGHIAELIIVAARKPGTTGKEGVSLFCVDASAAGVKRGQRAYQGYGYGLWIYDIKVGDDRLRVAKRPGRIMGAQAQLYRFLDRDLTVVIRANTDSTDLDEFVARIGKAALASAGASAQLHEH